MDVLSDVCRTIRLEGSVFFRSDLSAPWGIVLPEAHEPRFHIVLKGHLWFQTEKMSEPKKMLAGDTLIIPEGEWHWIADQVGRTPVPSAEAGAALLSGQPLFQGGSVTTRLICGLFRYNRTLPHPLFESMPPILYSSSDNSSDSQFMLTTARWLFDEFKRDVPGSDILLDRLCEVFFIQTLRFIQQTDTISTGFLSALKDGRINKALQQIHAQPEHAWTLDNLAASVAMSRAVFAERFNGLVGMPPKTYLTHWRMRLALNYLKETNLPAGTVATKVGYGSDAAFSRAFQRRFGLTPTEYRHSSVAKQGFSSTEN